MNISNKSQWIPGVFSSAQPTRCSFSWGWSACGATRPKRRLRLPCYCCSTPWFITSLIPNFPTGCPWTRQESFLPRISWSACVRGSQLRADNARPGFPLQLPAPKRRCFKLDGTVANSGRTRRPNGRSPVCESARNKDSQNGVQREQTSVGQRPAFPPRFSPCPHAPATRPSLPSPPVGCFHDCSGQR